MKLSKKLFFVPAVALAFGLVSCGDNTYNANDTISSPEVYVGTDASGVNFIKVNPVKDAGSYSIYRRPEGQDSWDFIADGQSVADSQWYFEADKTYQYKVVANAAANQGNLKSAETVKNVKTVKEFAANAPLAAADISVALKEGYTNTAVLSVKTNPASTYEYYVVTDVSLGAEAAISNVGKGGDINGLACAYVKGGKIVAGEYRDTNLVLAPSITKNTDYYVVIKETAVSVLNPATNYVVSAKVTGTPNAVSVNNVAVARVNPTAAVVTFDVDAVAGKAPEAKYVVYRNKTMKNGDVTAYEVVGEAAAVNNVDYVSTADVTKIYYQCKDVNVAKVDDKEVTKYTYVVVATAYGKSSQHGTNVDLTVATTSTETATATAVDPTVLKRFSVTQKDTSTSVSGTTTTTGGKDVVITAMINKEVPATGFKVLYGEFETKAEAEKATLAQLTKTDVTLDKFGSDTVVLNVEKETTDGAVTIVPEVSYSTYKKASFTLDAGSKTDKTVTYVTPTSGSATSSTVTTVTNKGKYYVFRLVVTHGDKEYVSTQKVYLTTKTTTTTTQNGASPATTETEVENTVIHF